MPVFDTVAKLNSYVESNTMKEIAKIASDYGAEVLREKIMNSVYRRQAKPSYTRTKSMLNSVASFMSGSGANREVQTYPDKNKMTEKYPSQYFGRGGSLDNRDNIVLWLDGGHKGYYNRRPVDYKPTNFMAKSMEKLEKTLIDKVTQVINNQIFFMTLFILDFKTSKT